MLLSRLVYDTLVGLPLTLSMQILEGLRAEVDRERLLTEEAIKARLQQLQLDMQEGELTGEEYEEMETALISRLRMIREYQKESSHA